MEGMFVDGFEYASVQQNLLPLINAIIFKLFDYKPSHYSPSKCPLYI